MPRATPSRRKSPPTPTTRKPAARRSPKVRSATYVSNLGDPLAWGSILGQVVSPATAVKVSSVFAVCRFVAQSVGCMAPRLKVRVGRKKLDALSGFGDPSTSVYRQATTALRVRPNPWQSPFDFFTLQAYWTALHGQGFARIVSGQRGAMTNLIPMHPARMIVKQFDDYTLGYEWFDEKGRWQQLSQTEVLHFRWLGDNGIVGARPTETLSTAITLARELDKAAMGLWRNGARPDFVIETSKVLDDTAMLRLRDQFVEMYGGENRGAPAVLDPHMKLSPMQSNTMEQSQFQQLRESILPEVCSHWGVPASLIGDAKAQRYGNPESDNLAAQIWCLLPWQKRIEGAINLWLQDTYGEDTFFQLDNRALLRGDSVARANLYRALFSMSAISPNEIRDLEDLPLLDDPEADKTYMQLGFGTLENVAKGVANGGSQSPAADAPHSDAPLDPSADPLAAAATGLDMSSTALNGAQVTALVAVLQQVSAGLLTEESAVALIQSAFPTVSYEAAKKIVSGAMPAPSSQGA